jgi:hypothetical protein
VKGYRVIKYKKMMGKGIYRLERCIGKKSKVGIRG